MEFNISVNTRSIKNKNKTRIHANVRRRQIQKERRSKIKSNKLHGIKFWGFNHHELISCDPKFDEILEQNHQEYLFLAVEVKRENELYRKYLSFIDSNRSPYENRKIEDVIPFADYKKALENASNYPLKWKKIPSYHHRICASPDGDTILYSDDDYDDFDDSEMGQQQYTLDEEEEINLNALLTKYDIQNMRRCDDEEECDCPRCTERREEQEALLDMCHPRNKIKSSRGGYF